MAGISEASPSEPRPRIDALDLLRGVVMVLMALDHARDYFSPTAFMPEDLPQSTPALFWTRWVTHFCAPVFVFLAGCGALLYGRRAQSRARLSAFLVTRGLWLVVLEFTLVHLAWWFTFNNGWPGGPYTMLFLQVIWAIGASMMLLGLLVWLPAPLIGALGVAIVAGHNAFEFLDAELAGDTGHGAPLWKLLHVARSFFTPIDSVTALNLYPLLPWFGVMAAGYGFGVVMTLPQHRRRSLCALLGTLLVVAFVLLRASNLYGDPQPWRSSPPLSDAPSLAEQSGTYALLSFLNTEKYPPSLLFVLMTLGPAILLLPLLERARGPVAAFFVTFGRVPLFYYLLHVALLNAGAAAYFQMRFGLNRWRAALMAGPPDVEIELWVAYAAWIGAVLLLWPLCRAYAALKRRSRSRWLSYL